MVPKHTKYSKQLKINSPKLTYTGQTVVYQTIIAAPWLEFVILLLRAFWIKIPTLRYLVALCHFAHIAASDANDASSNLIGFNIENVDSFYWFD